MITVSSAIVQHKGLMADNTTKLYVYLPELTSEQDAELIKLTKSREAGIIIVRPEFMEMVLDMLKQVQDLKDEEESQKLQGVEWVESPETGFISSVNNET